MAKKQKNATPVNPTLADMTEPDTTVATPQSYGDLPGFVAAGDFKMPEGTIVRSMSPMIKPDMFPVGRKLVGKFTKIFETEPTKGKKGVGIEIVPYGMPVGVALAAVTTIARALDFDNVEKGKEATSPYVGRYVVIEKLPNKIPSKQGQDAWNFLVAILPQDYAPVVLGKELPAPATN